MLCLRGEDDYDSGFAPALAGGGGGAGDRGGDCDYPGFQTGGQTGADSARETQKKAMGPGEVPQTDQRDPWKENADQQPEAA